VGYEEDVPDDLKTVLFDPQTAGGLLVAVDAARSAELLRELRAAGVLAAEIGEVLPRTKPLIAITP
jgi:selenide,water dikinase